MRRLLTVIGLVAASLWLVWTFRFHQQPVDTIFQPPPADPISLLPGGVRLTADLEDATLPEALAEIERQTGVVVAADPAVDALTPRVWLKFEDAPLESTLYWLARNIDASLTVQDDRLTLSSDESQVTRVYRFSDLPQQLGAEHLGQLLYFLDIPAALDLNSFQNEFESAGPSAVVLTASLRSHQCLQRLVDLLQQPDDFDLRPVHLTSPPDAEALAALEQEVEFDGETLRRREAVRRAAQLAGLKAVPGAAGNDRVLLHGKATVRAWIDALVARDQMSWTLYGRTLLVDDADSIGDDVHVYPVGDLWGADDSEDVRDLVQSLLGQEWWLDYGGAMESVCCGRLLLVRGSTAMHLQVEQMLEAVRRLQATRHTHEPAEVVRERQDERAWKRLGEPLGVDYVRAELSGIVRDIAGHMQIPVLVSVDELRNIGAGVNHRVDMSGPQRPLADALDSLAASLGLAASLHPGGVLRIEEQGEESRSRAYIHLPDWTPLQSRDDLQMMLLELAEMQAPEQWETFGGEGVGRAAGDLIGLAATPGPILAFQRVLAAVEALRRQPHHGILWIDRPAGGRLLDKLSAPIDLRLDNRPLAEAAREITERTGLPLRIAAEDRELPVSGAYLQRPVRHVLTELLAAADRSWELDAGAVVVRDPQEPPPASLAALWVEPEVGDAGRRHRLLKLIESAVDPWTWEQAGGEGRLVLIDDVLVIGNQWRVVERVHGLLGRLRRLREDDWHASGEQPAALSLWLHADESSRQARRLWDKPVSVSTEGLQLRQCAEQIAAEVGQRVSWRGSDVALADQLLLNVPAWRALEALHASSPRDRIPRFVIRDGVTAPITGTFPAVSHRVLLMRAPESREAGREATGWRSLLHDRGSWGTSYYDLLGPPLAAPWVDAADAATGRQPQGLSHYGDDTVVLAGEPDQVSRYRHVITLIRRGRPLGLEELPGWSTEVELESGVTLLQAVREIAAGSGLSLVAPDVERLRGVELPQPLTGPAGELLRQIAETADLRLERLGDEARLKADDPLAVGAVDAQAIDIRAAIAARPGWSADDVVAAIHRAVEPQSWASAPPPSESSPASGLGAGGFGSGGLGLVDPAKVGYLLPLKDDRLLVVHNPPVCEIVRQFVAQLAGATPDDKQLAAMLLEGAPAEQAAAVWTLGGVEPNQLTRSAVNRALGIESDESLIYGLAGLLLQWPPHPSTDLHRIDQLLDRYPEASFVAGRLRRIAARTGAPGGLMLGRRLIRETPDIRSRRKRIAAELQQHPAAAEAALPLLLQALAADATLQNPFLWQTLSVVPDHQEKIRKQLAEWQRSDHPLHRQRATQLRMILDLPEVDPSLP